tara:strand:+ start:473 stop:1171 length:699 start_codon:yes stop_codon:yes gene_type:complete
MLISLKKKLVFLSNPKCGSTSFERAVSTYCEIALTSTARRKHVTCHQFRTHWQPFLSSEFCINDLFVLCTTREPISKIISWYKYRSRQQLIGNSRWLGKVPFRQFCSAEMNKQYDSFFFKSDKLLADIVIPIDHASYLETFLGNEFNIGTFSKHNTSKKVSDHSLASKMKYSDYLEIASEELKRARKPFIESIERHNQISSFYKDKHCTFDLREGAIDFKNFLSKKEPFRNI